MESDAIRTSRGPMRAPARYETPPSYGAPWMTIAAVPSSSGRASRNLGAVMLGRGKAPRMGRAVWRDHVVHDLGDVERAALKLGTPVSGRELPFGCARSRNGRIQR